MLNIRYAEFGSNVSWDGIQVAFNMLAEGKVVRCAVTRSALAAISGRVLAHTPDMLSSFRLWRDEIEMLAWAKMRARPAGIHGRIVVTLDDTDRPPTGGSLARVCPEGDLLQAA